MGLGLKSLGQQSLIEQGLTVRTFPWEVSKHTFVYAFMRMYSYKHAPMYSDGHLPVHSCL